MQVATTPGKLLPTAILRPVYPSKGLDDIAGLPPGRFALVSKVHHAAIDGMGVVELSAAVQDLSPDAATPDP